MLGRLQSSSFKLKLVAYFVLLSLVPMAATYWGFSTVAGSGQSRQVTLRQEAGLRAALTLYQERADRAQAEAKRVARLRCSVRSNGTTRRRWGASWPGTRRSTSAAQAPAPARRRLSPLGFPSRW